MPSDTIHIGLLFNYSYSYYRNVLTGVLEYAETRPTWKFWPVSVDRGHLRWHSKIMPDILLATMDNAAYSKAVKKWHRPIVNISPVYLDSPYTIVEPDNDGVGRLAAEHFLERGFKNFAFTGHRTIRFSVEREAVFCKTIRKAGFEVNCHYVRKEHPFESHAQHWYLDRRAHSWLLSLPKPVGIYAPADLIGTELTAYCRELDLRVPADVAILGTGNDELYCSLARPTLSSVDLNGKVVGHEIGRLLGRLLSGSKPPKEPILTSPGGIRVRQSTDVLAIENEDVLKATQFIKEHFHLSITVDDVLKEVQISRRALELHFRRALGRGIAQEINRVRLDQSKRLLTETDFKVAAVARHAGFFSPRQQAATFQRELGISPSEFRRRLRFTGDSA